MYLSKRFAALPPRKKLVARLMLYGGLLLLVSLFAAGVAYFNRPLVRGRDSVANVEALAATPEVELLQEYIRIDTSPTTGSEIAGAEFLARQLEAAGLEPHIERLGTDNANLWAILEGTSREAIVLHNHIDVYPAGDPEAWDYPPYAGEIDRLWLYGRGAFDMKSVAVAQLMTITEMARDETPPKRSIIFLASGSEEIGSDLGSKWILASRPELVDRFSLVLTEGGVVEAISQDEIKYWGIEFGQKRFATGWACSPSEERLNEFRADLDVLSETNYELRLEPEIVDFLTAYAKSRDNRQTQEILNDLRSSLDHSEKFKQLPSYLKSLFRDETATFNVEPAEDSGYKMRFILHLLPSSDFDSVRRKLVPEWVSHGVAIELESAQGANHGSPLDSSDYDALATSVAETYPHAAIGPYFLAWSATDSRFFRQQGIPSYGFSPFLIFATDTFRRDTLNERIDLVGFVNGVNLYKRAIHALAD